MTYQLNLSSMRDKVPKCPGIASRKAYELVDSCNEGRVLRFRSSAGGHHPNPAELW